MKLFHFLLQGSKKQAIIAAAISIISASLYVQAIRSFNQMLEFDIRNSLMSFLIMIGAVILSSVFAVLASHYTSNHFEFKVSGQRIKMSELVLKTSFDKIEKKKGQIVPTLFNDIITIGNFAKTIPEFIVAFFTLLSMCIYMFTISWEFTLIFIGVFSVSMGIIIASRPYLFKEEKMALLMRNNLYTKLQGLADGLKELTLNIDHKKVYASELIGPASDGLAKRNVNRNWILIAMNKISETFILIAVAVMLMISIFYFESSKDFFVEFFTLFTFILPPLIKIGLFLSSIKKAEVAYDQIGTLDVMLQQMGEYKKESEKSIRQESEDSDVPLLSLRNIGYDYVIDDQKIFTVGPFDLDIKKNELLIINGGNGSGKTTLIKLLTGLYTPTEGTLAYGGETIGIHNLDAYRNVFAAVFADSFVFQDLRYINHNRIDELKTKYLEMLEIEDKVSLDDGIKLSTTSLSMGQMSRLNLFRALLEDKDIYIFDEWAANQDPYFKAKFYNEILPQLKKDGKTIIVISHDDAFYHIADRRVTVAQRKLSLS